MAGPPRSVTKTGLSTLKITAPSLSNALLIGRLGWLLLRGLLFLEKSCDALDEVSRLLLSLAGLLGSLLL